MSGGVRRRKKSGRSITYPYCMAMALPAMIVAVVAVLAFFGFVISKINVPANIVAIMSCIALCVGGYAGGYVGAKNRRNNGLAMGLLCGIFMFCILLIISLFFSGKLMGAGIGTKFALTLICSAVGGIVGVNHKGRGY